MYIAIAQTPIEQCTILGKYNFLKEHFGKNIDPQNSVWKMHQIKKETRKSNTKTTNVIRNTSKKVHYIYEYPI